MLVCLLKVYRDAGIELYSGDVINDYDYYYEYILEAIQYAAPIAVSDEKLYSKYGYCEDNGEVYIWAYSSKEMQEYYKIARKIHRLEGNTQKENLYIKEIENEIELIRSFCSYSFDYDIGNKRRGAQLEILWGYDFRYEIAMCLWIVRTMELFRKKLPKLIEKYRRVRREKRVHRNILRKGADGYAAA